MSLLFFLATIATSPAGDVGVVSIIAPAGSIDSGTVVIPQAVVHNFSAADTTIFPVTMNIGPVYSRTLSDTLRPGQSDTVSFPAWVAQPLGSMSVVCFTSFALDTNRRNDTLRTTIDIVRGAIHDIGTSVILSPNTVLYAGETVVPKAIIRNYGTAIERYFDVQFRIGVVYDRTVIVNSDLLPDGTVDVTFPPWIAREGYYPASCSTILARDTNPSNDRKAVDIAVIAPAILRIEPDRTVNLLMNEKEDIPLFAELDASRPDIIEIKPPTPPLGWRVALYDSLAAQSLSDTDGDGLPDLGSVFPKQRIHFNLRVQAPPDISGNPSSAGDTVVVRGFCHSDSTVSDSAVIVLRLSPEFTIHNYPNPFSERTTFWFGVPEPGRIRLTVYDRAGERVCRVIDNENYTIGNWPKMWDGTNDYGRAVAPGTYDYLFELEAGGRVLRMLKKLVITRGE